jgi:hypoxanthine-DNA glycosylase
MTKKVPDYENLPIEKHAFGAFLPEKINYLLVGTFPGKQFTQLPEGEVWLDELAWSYGGRNQFWRIMEAIYDVKLISREDKQLLFSDLRIGMMDLIASCSRKDDNNLDNNLVNITWNKIAFEKIFEEKEIKKIFCTGKGVAVLLKKWFPAISTKIIALPSPSPRYANLSFEEKKVFYEKEFPRI